MRANVNILPQMGSIYVWQGKLRSGKEHKMFIKTSAVAEVLQFKIDSGNREYLDWIKLSTQ